MMKDYLLATAIAVLSVMSFAGCAEQSTTTASGDNPATSTHSKNELQNTGRMQSGDALQAADPSVQTTSGRR